MLSHDSPPAVLSPSPHLPSPSSPVDYTNLSSIISSPWSPTSEFVLLEPYTYLLSNKGKEIRSLLIDAFNVWLDVPSEDLEVIRKVVEMLHTGSLLMDDVEDSSLLRRGSPVAHLIFGVPQVSSRDVTWKGGNGSAASVGLTCSRSARSC